MRQLPLPNKLLYATSSAGSNIVFQAAAAWLIFFWSPPVEAGKTVYIPIAVIGLLLGIGRFIEAFDDPLIGWLSDRIRTKWGRRAPFIVISAPLVAVFFFLLFTPPQNQSGLFYIAYFFVILQIFFLAHTLSEAPLAALLPEIAKSSGERVGVSAWKVIFGVIGAALGLVGTGLIIERFGFGTMAAMVGLISAVTFYLALFGTFKYQNIKVKPATGNFWTSLVGLSKNRAFLAFSAGLVFFGLGVNLLTQLLPFFVKVILSAEAGTVSVLAAILMAVMVISLPLMSKLAGKFSKKTVYAFSMLVVAAIFPLLYFVGFLPILSKFQQAAIFMAILGLPFAAQFLFPNALMADVVDEDFVKTGQRREALYYSLQDTLLKFSLAGSAIIFGLVLQFAGYSQENPFGLRVMGVVAAIFVLLGFGLFSKYYNLPNKIEK